MYSSGDRSLAGRLLITIKTLKMESSGESEAAVRGSVSLSVAGNLQLNCVMVESFVWLLARSSYAY